MNVKADGSALAADLHIVHVLDQGPRAAEERGGVAEQDEDVHAVLAGENIRRFEGAAAHHESAIFGKIKAEKARPGVPISGARKW